MYLTSGESRLVSHSGIGSPLPCGVIVMNPRGSPNGSSPEFALWMVAPSR